MDKGAPIGAKESGATLIGGDSASRKAQEGDRSHPAPKATARRNPAREVNPGELRRVAREVERREPGRVGSRQRGEFEKREDGRVSLREREGVI